MAQSNIPDEANSPSSNVPLRATPGQFDWIRMHPSLCGNGLLTNSPPPHQTPHTARRPFYYGPNHVSTLGNESRRVSAEPRHRSGHSRQALPAISSRQQPSTTQRTDCASPEPAEISSLSVPHSPNLSAQVGCADRSPDGTQMQISTPSYQDEWRSQFRPSARYSYPPKAPSPRRYSSVSRAAQQMPSHGSPSQSSSTGLPSSHEPCSSSSVPSGVCLPRPLRHEIKRMGNSTLPMKGSLGISNSSPSTESTNLESIDPRLIEFDAVSTQKRIMSRETSENGHSMDEERTEDFLSDDEDFAEWQASLEKLRTDREFFQASQNPGRRKNDIVARGGYKGPRGPRKAAEPTGDIKARLGEAAKAFLVGNYLQAKDICQEIIRINAETHEAWTTVASCFMELGYTDKALTAHTFAATLQPKNVSGWLRCAERFLEETGKRRGIYLTSAFYCYSAALKADVKNIEARLGKARILVEKNNYAAATLEYKKVLPLQPRNLELVRDLCAGYYDIGELENAATLFHETFAQFMEKPSAYKEVLDWSDLNSYIAIRQELGHHEFAIKELASISRWMLGRGSEDFWNNVTGDDREWDADDSRRVEVSGFTKYRFPLSTYGDGLPLELRTKLGISRLELGYNEEAMRHFEWLRGSDEDGAEKIVDYFDLYRQVADKLHAVGLYQHALEFYEPLTNIPEEATADLYLQLAHCFKGQKLQAQAEKYFQTTIQLDENNIEARMELAKMYESLGEQEQAFIYVNEVMMVQNRQSTQPMKQRKRGRRPKVDESAPVQSKETSGHGSDDEGAALMKEHRHKKQRLADPVAKMEEEASRAEQLQSQYRTLRSQHEAMLNGNPEAAQVWMKAARDLTDDFRGVRSFYPFEKYVHFVGYKKKESRAGADVPLDEATAMAERLSQRLGADIAEKSRVTKIDVPEDYRGISFSSWLDLFIDFGLCLARHGKRTESYEICEAAKDCALWYHSRKDLFLIHLGWITCALFLGDEESCVSIARFFMKEYQFTTDSYRMFSAVSRMVHSPISWYSSGPSQKYILRQIKAMDYILADEESKAKYFAERGSYSAVDENGQLIINDDLDIALLMLYGHILYTSSSYIYALNYFLRALALDPDNPMINFNVGLAYIHYAFRRQADNRQHLILQGMTFLFNYYDCRKNSDKSEERQEAHYNIARAYHMLGLTHLAINYYNLMFNEIEDNQGVASKEDLAIDAAYNLQSIYAMAGNHDLAGAITRKWLVI